MNSPSELFETIYDKFKLETGDLIRAGKVSHALYESGQPRLALRKLLLKAFKASNAQLDVPYQLKLCLMTACDFNEAGEYNLAVECYETALEKCELVPDLTVSTKNRVQVLHEIVTCNINELLKLRTGKLTPMLVTQILHCLRQLRESIDAVFKLPVRLREDLAWQVLNSAKLIMEIQIH